MNINQINRICKQCNIAKSINDFYKTYCGTHTSKCKKCTSYNNLKNIYNAKLHGGSKNKDFKKHQKILMDQGKRQCLKCKEVKVLSDYHITRNKYTSYCKLCYCNNAKEYHKHNYVSKAITRDECGVPLDKRDELIDLYKNSTFTLCEIAKKIGVNVGTLYAWQNQGIFNGMERLSSTFSYERAKQGMLMKEGKRLCRTCNEVKLLNNFYYGNKGYLSYCKTCMNAPKRPLQARVECNNPQLQQSCVDIVVQNTNIPKETNIVGCAQELAFETY
jgi:hypothetical protein